MPRPDLFFNVDCWCPWTNIQPCVQKFATQVFFFENIFPVSITKVSFKRFKLIKIAHCRYFSSHCLLCWWQNRSDDFIETDEEFIFGRKYFSFSAAAPCTLQLPRSAELTHLWMSMSISPQSYNLNVTIFKTAKYNLHKTFNNHL